MPAGAGAAFVLVIEGDPETNRILCESLAPHYRVAAAFDGKQGLDVALALRPDLVLANVMLPAVSSDQLVRVIRSRRAFDRTAIALLAARADDNVRGRMLREGAQDYIVRPFAGEELRARIDRLLAAKAAGDTAGCLDSFLDQAPDGIFVADLDGRYTEVNAAGCRMLGYEREEIVGKTIADLIPSDSIDRLERDKEQLLRGEQVVSEWLLRKKDGDWLPVEVSAKILPDGRWQGFVRDISERNARAEVEHLANPCARSSGTRPRS